MTGGESNSTLRGARRPPAVPEATVAYLKASCTGMLDAEHAEVGVILEIHYDARKVITKLRGGAATDTNYRD